ncbi:P-type conjugative transfer protein TrbJ [Henriciella mobilis]|jgi:P-type conjugative transfer protein TrbJ|uniref:P-type conjugative transfer protein TrbJ n=1 Tax=Henriciella mobilis TaxID=2305467 RepID=UPI000E66375D|nr:P-type conjugative transfer protein TrbJ [Henriciella mobilis]RIJ16467.1 P-type conjugative transfer protein TrbJ [Henriciella mobilis]RIJ22580.1 P-type conjugative transfer protein TrbJ [Henriciella mobilis]|tara:strand:+ start:12621 stop:13322 length:702 start_codon:yes stop_codon:yes gene_type:complete
MKRLLSSVLICAAPLSLALPAPASAQIAVYDPVNHVQNILQGIRTLQEINQQIQQLTHEIEMLENMARNLETLPVNVAEAIIADRIRRIHELMREAEGIGYGVEEVEREYEVLYPESYGETPPREAVLVEEARARWRQSRSAYRDTLVTVATALEDNETDAAAIAGLVDLSQSAAGALQATQAGNQIEALQTEQLMQMEAMMAAHYRAEALERARQLAEAERGRARTRAFLGE